MRNSLYPRWAAGEHVLYLVFYKVTHVVLQGVVCVCGDFLELWPRRKVARGLVLISELGFTN